MKPDSHTRHKKWMQLALYHARQELGRTAPNPSVGCVIVKNGQVIAAARTADGGRPHAETIALQKAGEAAKGASVYVTLEPCSHHGQTPPCAGALIKAGVTEVIIGCVDEAAHVNGDGIKALENAGIHVISDILEAQCRAQMAGFFLTQTENRPLVTLKLATTLDGKIATAAGESKWITGALARRRGHLERARHDAIMIGVNTALADNPSLTCRLPGYTKPMTRIVLDSALRMAENAALFDAIATDPVILVHHAQADSDKKAALESAGATCLAQENMRDMQGLLSAIADEGMTRLLVEGGGQVHASFLKAGLCDRIVWFRSSRIMGGDGVDAVGGLDVQTMTDLKTYRLEKTLRLDDDRLEIFEKAR